MSDSTEALERYRRLNRRRLTVYYAAVAVLVLVVGTITVVTLATGEAAHTSLRTVSRQPAGLTLTAADADQHLAWRTSERTAIGTPLWRGTVITYSTHSVGGRDARTGAETWRYTRTDRTVCTAAQIDGTTVALFDRNGTCDEVDAFDSGTGQRSWTRTLDEDGQPVTDAYPSYQATDETFMVVTPSVIYAMAIDDSGIDRFTYSRYGCRIERAVLGSAGLLLSQDCSAKVRCTGISFCGKGPQLLLRNQMGRGDKSTKNYDQIVWNDVGNTGIAVTADSVLGAVQPGSDVVDVLNPANGKQTGTVALSPAPGSLQRVVTIDTTTAEVLWIDGTVHVIAPGSSAATWSSAAPSPPTVVDAVGDDLPPLSTSRVTVVDDGTIDSLDPAGGMVTARYDVGELPSGSVARPIGSGFLVSSSAGTAVYR